MLNEITAGQTRVGALVDVDGLGTSVPATLELVDGVVKVSVPWDRHGSTACVESWFKGAPGAVGSAMPKDLAFEDSGGLVHLVSCYSLGWASNPIADAGQGRLSARYVVPDKATAPVESFARVTDLRSTISGLRAWMNSRTISQETRSATAGTPATTTFTLAGPEPVAIPGVPGLSLIHAASVAHDNAADSITLREVVYVETMPDAPSEWEPLLATHDAIRDLVALSTWRTQHLQSVTVRPDGPDPDRQFWRQVIAPRVIHELPPPRQAAVHVIEFADIGAEGVAAWIEMRKAYARALDPVISILLREAVASDTALTSAGIGLEGLAFFIATQRGLAKPGYMKFHARLRLIGTPLAPVLNFDLEDWIDGTSAAYTGLKHANQAHPDPVEVNLRARQTIQVVRAWVATELGVKADQIKRRIVNGRLT
jgi:hypothetical protein